MTDTDLITAGESTDTNKLSDAVSPDTPDVETPIVSAGSLSTMVLPELRALANQAGVKGTSGMRKNELIAAIQESQGTGQRCAPAGVVKTRLTTAATDNDAPTETTTAAEAPAAQEEQNDSRPRRRAGNVAVPPAKRDRPPAPPTRRPREAQATAKAQATAEARPTGDADKRQGGQRTPRPTSAVRTPAATRVQQTRQWPAAARRSMQRRRRRWTSGPAGTPVPRPRPGAAVNERARAADAELREDDVVQPVAGILDVLDNYAFVRTSGYLAGPHDVYVSMNMVRKNGLRRGDAVTGAVRVPKDGEQPNQRQKFNPLVRLDSINGGSVEDAKKRPDFTKLTPLYPNQRLRLETTPDRLTTRVIDLIMPIGKGQRALIVSPPKAGKTTILQDIANAITKNNPECHLMVVLVDERPEEVTDMTRSVKGEVIASTFDRPPSDHTSVAELAIERAKRLVEQGKDVVVLLDSITRLGRAYNNASPASGRILSGGVDSTALYPPKRFLGAARNIEEGGSLTIIATAMVETGSTGDTVIFEEFKGTGNAELKLDRKISERRVFPAVDVNPSGTRKDELLLSPDEFGIVHKLRRVLSGLDSHQAIDLLMSQLRKTKTNYEFLVQVSKTTPEQHGQRLADNSREAGGGGDASAAASRTSGPGHAGAEVRRAGLDLA